MKTKALTLAALVCACGLGALVGVTGLDHRAALGVNQLQLHVGGGMVLQQAMEQLDQRLVMGLNRQSSIPASMQRSFSSGWALAVRPRISPGCKPLASSSSRIARASL